MCLYTWRRAVRRWMFVPLVIVGAVGLANMTFPSHLRAWISTPFMDRFALRCLELPPNAPIPQPGWIDLDPVCNINRGVGMETFEIPTNNLWSGNVEVTYCSQRIAKGRVGCDPRNVIETWYFSSIYYFNR